MTDRAEANRLVAAFVQAWNGRDVTALAEIFHPDFRWHIAVTDYNDPTLRPLQSKLLAGKNLPWAKSIYDKAETLAIFGRIFAAVNRFSLRETSIIVDGDRIAVELVGEALNKANGRRCDNLYCYVFRTARGRSPSFGSIRTPCCCSTPGWPTRSFGSPMKRERRYRIHSARARISAASATSQTGRGLARTTGWTVARVAIAGMASALT